MFGKAINGIKYWGQLFLLPIYWLSFLFPRNKNIWLFGSTFGRRFADNPRYFFLYCSQHKEDILIGKKKVRPIWISHDKSIVEFLIRSGYESYYYHSLKGIWYCLRGRIYFFDNYSKDISFWLSGGAKKFNMWHGVPLKKIQHDNIFDKFRHPENPWQKWKSFPRTLSDEKPSHYVLTTSEYMKDIFSSAFKTDNVCTKGYPRVDGFAYGDMDNIYTDVEQEALNKINAVLSKDSDKKMIYYMPTFRDSETQFFDIMDLSKFNEFLRRENILLCTKLHPKSKLKDKFEEIESENIINIPADTDPYVFINKSDGLITDYSSIYFDYLFAGKPICFFDYDLQIYLEDSREMYFDYDEFTPGEKACNQAELEKVIVNICRGLDDYKEERESLQDKVFDITDKSVCGGLVEYLKTII